MLIDSLGALGDGAALTPSGRLHVPFAAPGDRLRVAVQGKDRGVLIEILAPGPARVTPPCPHFGRCGGCALQHLDPAFIADWKRTQVAAALTRAGIGDAPVAPTISIAPRTRRRATLAAKRAGRRITLGFTERAAHRLVDLAECPVLRPELAAAIAPLREGLAPLLQDREAADIALTLTEAGIDLTLIRQRAPTLPDREALATLAEALDLARVSWRARITTDPEPIVIRRTPTVRLGVRDVVLPSGSFLQPSEDGEARLVGIVLDALEEPNGAIVDLFAGMGTFALPASAKGPVAAYDADRDAIAALLAVRSPGIVAHHRDLFREPLTPTELSAFKAAIIDPPRAGAIAQAKTLAASRIPLIVYASCNPISFARDAAILVAGGYRLEAVTPIDQFPWSPHIELAGAFRR